MSTSTVPQPVRGQVRKAAYTDTDTLQGSASAKKKLPGTYTDVDVLTKGKTPTAGRPGRYADADIVIGRMSAWGGQGSYTDADR